MANSTVTYREIRFVIEDLMTQVYVLCEAGGDSPLGVQGWHHKAFPASKSVVDIVISLGSDKPVLWPQSAPTS